MTEAIAAQAPVGADVDILLVMLAQHNMPSIKTGDR